MTGFKVIDKLVFLLLAVLTIAFYSCLFIEEVDINFKIFACTLPFWLAAFIYIVSKKQLIERSIWIYIDLHVNFVIKCRTFFVIICQSTLPQKYSFSGHFETQDNDTGIDTRS